MAIRNAPNLPARPRLLVPVAVAVLLILILGGVLVSLYTDLLWFRETGFSKVFSTVLRTKLLLFAIFGLLMAIAIGVNLALAYRMRPPFRPMSLEQQNLEKYRLAVERFMVPVMVGVSLVFGLFAGIAAAGRYETWLLWRNGASFGINDPEFGKDLSFYMFSYPMLRFALGFVMAILVLSLLVSAVMHYLFGGVRLQSAGERISVGARVHLSVLIGLIVLVKAVGYWLDRYGLLYSLRGVVQGGSYTDINAVLPAKTLLVGIAIICGLLFFANIIVRNVLLPAGALALLVVSSIALGGIYPALVQQFQVKPNEVAKESEYIDRNITATRAAYEIDDVEIQQYNAVATADKAALRNDVGTIPNARLLDPNILGPTFKNDQGIRNYFGFNNSLDIDRYTVDGKTQDYVVAVREVDHSRLSADQRNWINLHLTYTHGNGFVAAPANSAAADGSPQFTVKNVPPTGPGGEFEITQPQVYYGEESPEYSIVNTKQAEIDGPGREGGEQATVNYAGPGGIQLDSGFKKLLFALKFREKNVLLSSALTQDSKLMYIRKPAERVAKVAPFLKLDADPYPAVIEGKLTWIIDGYTTSAAYPYSQRTQLGAVITDSRGRVTTEGQVNYIRNSVKATVDAYTGKVTLYTWDEKDPILKTWKKVFPGIVQDKGTIGDVLEKHLRYPEDMFKVQRELMSQYHVTDAKAFYGKEDFWEVPADPTQDAAAAFNRATPGAPVTATTNSGGDGPAQPPYYVLLQFPGQDKPQFSLTSTFVARGRPNLTAFASVSSDPGEGYGKIRILQLPKGTVIAGPGLVANQFESNTEVSTKLSLLRSGGSEVVLGNLLTLPVGNGLLYIEPVYTQGRKEPKFPILNSVIVSFGSKIVYKPTLAEALDELFGAGTVAPVGPTPSASPGGPPPSAPSTQALVAAAQKAFTDGQEALKRGDFAAYGVAQTRLKQLLDQIAARG